MENELCDHEILALDEEGDSFNFTTLNTLINLSLDGALNFVPGILIGYIAVTSDVLFYAFL